MKKIYVAVWFMFGLQSMSMQAAQESLQNVENGRQTMIHDAVKNLPYLTKGFDFLQTQNLVDTSFHDFLEQHVSHDEDGNEDMNFDQVIVGAEDVLTKNMKDTFLNKLYTAIKEERNLGEFHNPLFLYVMQHKDTTMRDMVRLWLLEWSKIQDEDGMTPLYQAAINNRIEIVHMFITAGVDLNIKNERGQTPLLWTAMNDHIEIVRMLIDAGAELNIQDSSGWAPLHFAAMHNRIEIVRMLIDAGAELNIQDSSGWAPLHDAVSFSSIEVARILIAAGADLNIQNNYGGTAEHSAGSPEMKEIFAQAREKQHEKMDAQVMKRFEQLIRKDWQ